MGLIKLAAKIAGSVTLSAVGIVASVGKGISDIVGADGVSNVMDTVKNGTFNVAGRIWNSIDVMKELDEATEILFGVAGQLADTANANYDKVLERANELADEAAASGYYEKAQEIRDRAEELNERREIGIDTYNDYSALHSYRQELKCADEVDADEVDYEDLEQEISRLKEERDSYCEQADEAKSHNNEEKYQRLCETIDVISETIEKLEEKLS